MDGENNGLNPIKVDDFGGENPLCSETSTSSWTAFISWPFGTWMSKY